MLDVDFARSGDEVVGLERAGADRLQWDIMDGHFVPRLTHGADLVRIVRDATALPFEAHLMVDHPERTWTSFARGQEQIHEIDRLVAGSAVHRHPAGWAAAIRGLRDAATVAATDAAQPNR